MAKKKRKKGATLLPIKDKTSRPAASAIQLWTDIQDGLVDPKTLTINQRRAIVLVALSDGEHTTSEIAVTLGVRYNVVHNDIRALRREIGDAMIETTFSEMLGDLVQSAEKCYARAMASGAVGLAWKIKSEAVKLYLQLGLHGPKEPEKKVVEGTINVVHTYDRSKNLMADITVPALTGEVTRGEQRGKLTEIKDAEVVNGEEEDDGEGEGEEDHEGIPEE